MKSLVQEGLFEYDVTRKAFGASKYLRVSTGDKARQTVLDFCGTSVRCEVLSAAGEMRTCTETEIQQTSA